MRQFFRSPEGSKPIWLSEKAPSSVASKEGHPPKGSDPGESPGGPWAARGRPGK